MAAAVELVELRRGGRLESRHRGHAVVVDETGAVAEAWGDPDLVTYPRSAAKPIQALPLLDSGAADAAGLGEAHLALACASHKAAANHTGLAAAWLAGLGLSDDDLRCGPQEPRDRAARDALIRAGAAPAQVHNNCSGKHCGFLTVGRHLDAGPNYVDPDHSVQRAVRDAWEEVTGETSPGYGIDGCSAPNFATTLTGLARGMAGFATAHRRSGSRSAAQARLVAAMLARPELVSGERGTCTRLMRACAGRAAVKGGAEGVYVAMLPDRGLGVALKVEDGADRAKDVAMAAILHRLGALPEDYPVARPIRNWAGVEVGRIQPSEALTG